MSTTISQDARPQTMDKDHFTRILVEHAGLLSRIGGSYEADPGLREDLLQDIALALWKAIPTWRGDASLKTFVARVAHNRGAAHVAKAVRQAPTHASQDGVVDTAHGPQAHLQTVQNRLRLQNAVRALPLTLRQPVTLALEGFSQREAAEALGITTNNVAVRLHRARIVLKKALGEQP